MESERTAQTTDDALRSLERTLRVINRMGVHARPATKIVELTNRYGASISFTKDGETVDGKSIFGVMTLAAVQGTEILARAEGEDAAALLDALETLFRSGFEEEDSGAAAKPGDEESLG